MLDLPQSRDVTLDRDVVGWIGKHHLGFVVPQNLGIAFGEQGVAAEQAMLAKSPEVAWLAFGVTAVSMISCISSS